MESLRPNQISRRRFLRTTLAATGAGAGLALFGPSPDKARGERPPIVKTLAQDIRHSAAELSRGISEGLRLGLLDSSNALALDWGRDRGIYHSPVVELDLTFTHVGLHWLADYPEGSNIQFEVRTSVDGSTWSSWRRVYVEAEAGQAARAETYGALISEERGRYLQYRATFQQGVGGSPILDYVTMTLINSLDGPRLQRIAPLPGLASLLLPEKASAAVVKPVTFTREQWGADESLRFRGGKEIWPRMYIPTKKAVVHHTADPASDYRGNVEGAKATVRAIYYYHAVTLGWGDIGYNALIDGSGNSYEGRYGRKSSSFDDLTWAREILSEDVVAGHASAHNYGTIGIALLGNFEVLTPSADALAKLKEILIYECSYHRIDPQQASDFLRYDNLWNRGLKNICGHKDCQSTLCPGANLYSQLPALRDAVVSALTNPSVPSVQTTSGPDGATVIGGSASYQWSGTGSAYSYYLEGWSADALGNVKYLSGFTNEKAPLWGSWIIKLSNGYQSLSPAHYTFHVQTRDSLGNTGVYEANRTFLAKRR